MGTNEQAALGASVSNNNASKTDIQKQQQQQQQQQAEQQEAEIEVHHEQKQQKDEQQQQQKQQQQPQKQQEYYAQLPKALPPPQVIIIPATQASTVATNAAKKIRRAFTMPRNPFRWSRKFKTATAAATTITDGDCSPGGSNSAITSCVGGGRGRAGSIVSLNSYEAISKDANGLTNQIKVQNGLGVTKAEIGDCVGGNDGGGGGGGSNCIVNDSERGAVITHIADEKNDKIERKIGGKQNRNIANGTNGSSSSSASASSSSTTATTTTTTTTATNTANNNTTNRIFRRSSFRKFLNRIAQHVSNTVNIGSTTSSDKPNYLEFLPLYTGCWRRQEANKQTISLHHNNVISNTDRVPPINGYQWPSDQTPGVMGLKNHGNTCFMNAVLQCLSHTDILAEYFVLDQYKADLKRRNKINSRKFGTKGELTEQLANVLKALWTCKNESDHSTSFKAVVDRYGSQFRSSTQHDAQEFLFWLLDKVHEDLNTATKRKYKSVKNSYGRPDEIIAAETLANHIRCNNSFVQAVFQAQFRSSLTCPRCKKQSNTFDPFHCISVQLPQLLQQNVFVTVIYLTKQPRQVKLGLRVPAGSPIIALREQLQNDTGIAGSRMVLVDINKEGFTRVFYDTQPIETLNGIETIYCIEVPDVKSLQAKSHTENATTIKTPTNTTESAVTIAMATITTAAAPTPPTTTTTVGTTTNTAEKSKSSINTANAGNSEANQASELLLLVANVRKKTKIKEQAKTEEDGAATATATATTTATTASTANGNAETETILERFGIPFSMRSPRDCSYADLQKNLLREMRTVLKPEVLSATTTSHTDMFQMRLQCPSADPDSYLEQVEHPLLTEMIDMALSVLSTEAGPAHIKLLLEWPEPEQYFDDLSDTVVEHESVASLRDSKPNETQALTLEQCLEHYTKAETLSAEDAWRCPHCQQYLPVVKTLGLWSLPDILVVHFKRFRQHQEKGPNAAKLTTMVKFPLNAFDMSPHLARGATENGPESLAASTMTFENYRPSPWRKSRPGDSRSSTLNSRDNRETRYDLYAVCYHQGDTLETGHYTAACKNPYDHQWYKFDDQRVAKVPNESIQEDIINNEAYMLFYQRRNDNNECSGSSSNSGGDHWVSRLPPPPGATPVPMVEKFTATTEKTLTPKSEETKLIEEETIAVGKAEVKPVEIPKVDNCIEETVKEAAVTTPTISMSPTVVQVAAIKPQVDQTETIQKPSLLDIEKIDFADADDQHIVDQIDANIVNHEQQFKTDILGKPQMKTIEKSLLSPTMNNNTPMINAKAQSPQQQTKHTKEDINQQPATASKPKTLTPTSEPTKKILQNGFTNGTKGKYDHSNHTNGLSTKSTMNGNKVNDINSNSDTESSTSSSTSSLSSRSSPHELSTSINGATTLQTKFNGFASATYTSPMNSHKETFLSSSLKSNSSSIIGTNANHSMSQQQEFQLSRYQRQNWNGSRFSVSAVENATTVQANSHAHGLNLRHSFSTSSNYKLRECNETLSSLLRNTANTCSKDTLLFIDQQTHHHHPNSLLEDDDDTFMGSRSLWISPVTPHKLITVSPKN